MTNIYNYFDDIVCINLDFRKDRRAEAQKYFTELNIPANFLTVKKHEKGGRYGCFDSHIKVLKYAQANNYTNILVFEDDVMPTKGYNEKIIKKAVEFMQNNKDWDILYFGYSFMDQNQQTIFTAPNYNDDIIIYKPLLTHAFCYSQRGINTILKTYKPYLGKTHYDQFLVNHKGLKSFCILPLMFNQNWTSEHNNSTHNLTEEIVRQYVQPIIPYLDLHYNMSMLRYKYKEFLMYLCIIFICILLIYLMIKQGKT
jgi:GR25 family glycosyltransferase involved in LPS biosynthesis